jgi:cell division protein FtsA
MADGLAKPIKLFYCYAQEDKALRDQLDRRLKYLERSGLVESWYDGEIIPGEQWKEEINNRLNTADIILLLISPDFIASDYYYSNQMTQAIARHDADNACVIPILLRPTFWKNAPLTNAAAISVRIDGQVITNPVGFKGRNFSLTLFSAFAPLAQLGALVSVAQGLDLTLISIVAEPFALARCLSANAAVDSGAIFIDVGGGTTDIALVRQGGIEETRMFALGGRAFTHRIATSKGISLQDAERIKISYSNGEIKSPHQQEEIQAILAAECQTWMDIVELLIEELAKGELLPPAIYIVGGGSALPDLYERLKSFPWVERLPFSRQPLIRVVQPEMVASIIDHDRFLTTAQDITPMALAYQAVELSNENNVMEEALNRVVEAMGV